MNVLTYPDKETLARALQRPSAGTAALEEAVGKIMSAVKQNGDAALREFTRRFDGVSVDALQVSEAEMEAATKAVDDKLISAIRQAKKNIAAFHGSQRAEEKPVETSPGVTCWRKSIAIENVGLYIPGGSAPLFSTVLMLAVPARLAGCGNIVLCTPPGGDGNIHPAVLFTCLEAGVTQVFRVGGAQAIAAMAWGTASVPRVDKIFGPGNAYVTAAKMLVHKEGVAIDLPAGPSEVMVVADGSALPSFVAADLLSQAEHGADSQVALVATDGDIMNKILAEVKTQLDTLPRKEIAAKALQGSLAILVRNTGEALAVANAYAPEHLILAVEDAEAASSGVKNAGSVFLGNYSPEAAGDYASGTNHTLPTGGWARSYSGVSLDSFVKKITFQRLSAEGTGAIGPAVAAMARAEGLEGHARAMELRMNSNKAT